jgi:hypothetical protein
MVSRKQFANSRFACPQKCSETGARVKAWKTRPIDGTVNPDQSRRLGVSDKAIIFEFHIANAGLIQWVRYLKSSHRTVAS